jgi:hypothetical protein
VTLILGEKVLGLRPGRFNRNFHRGGLRSGAADPEKADSTDEREWFLKDKGNHG